MYVHKTFICRDKNIHSEYMLFYSNEIKTWK